MKNKDVYFEFTPNNHFKPKIDKADFYLLKDDEFCWLILEPLSLYVENQEYEIDRAKRFSLAQKALYYWWYLDAQVTGGGFEQFYSVGYYKYSNIILEGLSLINDSDMIEMLEDANKIYLENKEIIDNGLLYKDYNYSHIIDIFRETGSFYEEIRIGTIELFEEYIRKNPHEFCYNDEGNDFISSHEDFDEHEIIECKTYHPNNNIKNHFFLQEGDINGTFSTYFENGNLYESVEFYYNEKTGIKKEYYENGTLKHLVKELIEEPNIHLHEFYNQDGTLIQKEHRLKNSEKKVGEYIKWYPNGIIAEKTTYIPKTFYDFISKTFYENGNKEKEHERLNDVYKIKNYWAKNGEQLLKNGDGLYIDKYKNRTEKTIYKNFLKNGKYECYENNILLNYVEYKDGKKNGDTRNYYNNGNLKEEILYKNEELISKETYPLYRKPTTITMIDCQMEDEWLINRDLETADVYPILKNKDSEEKKFKPSVELFERHGQESIIQTIFLVDVNKTGKVTNLKIVASDDPIVPTMLTNYIKSMTFVPAIKGNNNVDSFIMMWVKLKLDEQKV